ncbi:hypothetical protein Tco_0280750 [Tanacetum coccineum]
MLCSLLTKSSPLMRVLRNPNGFSATKENVSDKSCGRRGGRGGSISMKSGTGGGWLAKHLMESNVGYGGGRLVVLGARGGVVSGRGVVFSVARSSLGAKPSGARGVVGGKSRGVEGGAT